MDQLKTLTSEGERLLKRLGDLSEPIDHRQVDLAEQASVAFTEAASESKTPGTMSIHEKDFVGTRRPTDSNI